MAQREMTTGGTAFWEGRGDLEQSITCHGPDHPARQPTHSSYLFFISTRQPASTFQGEGWRLGDRDGKHFLLWNTLSRRGSKELLKAQGQENALERNKPPWHSTYSWQLSPEGRQR